MLALALAALLTTGSAQSLTRDQTITNAFLSCANGPPAGHSCPSVYSIDDCFTAAQPDLWTLFDTHHNSTGLSTTPLAAALPAVAGCVCNPKALAGLEECAACVRGGAGVKGEIDLYGVGWVAENACGVVLKGFELGQEHRVKPGPEQVVNPVANGSRNGTAGGGNTNGTEGGGGGNGTVEKPNPTPSATGEGEGEGEGEGSAPRESPAAAVFMRHVAPTAGIAAVVAFGFSML